MNKIDTSKWKEFYIKDIFKTIKLGNTVQVPTGAYVSAKELVDGEIPRITVTGVNNGISGFFNSKSKDFRVYSNFISLSFLGTIFYHKGQASLDMKVHCLKLNGKELNENLAMFLISTIKNAIHNLSSSGELYADQLSSTIVPNIKIKLPITDFGEPNWLYMEEYIKNKSEEMNNKYSSLKLVKRQKNNLDISQWKKFHLYDLFDILPGTKLDKSKMKISNPTINFVGRANNNNGVTTTVDKIDNLEPYPSGSLSISLGGEYLGSCFIQDNPFYTSQNVNVLIPKVQMSEYVKLFISTIIFKESRTHYKAFVDELNRHIRTDFTFILPVDDNNEPDYKYMENYMANLKNKILATYTILKDIS